MADDSRGSDLLIVDNSHERWKVSTYLQEWCELSKRFDIATGNFEIGGLLVLGDAWQKVDEIRILMGESTSLRTKQAFELVLLGSPTGTGADAPQPALTSEGHRANPVVRLPQSRGPLIPSCRKRKILQPRPATGWRSLLRCARPIEQGIDLRPSRSSAASCSHESPFPAIIGPHTSTESHGPQPRLSPRLL